MRCGLSVIGTSESSLLQAILTNCGLNVVITEGFDEQFKHRDNYELLAIEISGAKDQERSERDALKLLHNWQRSQQHAVRIVAAKSPSPELEADAIEVGCDLCLNLDLEIELNKERTRSLLRRLGRKRWEPQLKLGNAKVDLKQRIISGAGSFSRLSPTEAKLIEILSRTPERVFTKEELSGAIWHQADSIHANNLNVHLSRLRKKLEVYNHANAIQTVTGYGYKFTTNKA